MSDHFNNLSPGEAERLAMLAEECAEVIQIVGKILRHGYESCHPNDQYQTTNRELMAGEFADILAVQTLMLKSGDYNPFGQSEIDEAVKRKLVYSHHQGRFL